MGTEFAIMRLRLRSTNSKGQNVPYKNTHKFTGKQIQESIHNEKRSYERVHTNIDVRFYCGNIFYAGTAINLSKAGMLIRTNNCLPMTSGMVIVLRDGNALLQVVSRVKRLNTIEGHIDGMGIEILNPSNIYRNFVNGLGSL